MVQTTRFLTHFPSPCKGEGGVGVCGRKLAQA